MMSSEEEVEEAEDENEEGGTAANMKRSANMLAKLTFIFSRADVKGVLVGKCVVVNMM
jgi:hypothetical protein